VEALAMPGGVCAPAPQAEIARARLCLYTPGSEDVPATGLNFDALPPPATFVALLAPSAAPPATGSLTDLLGA
jgi:hypothetical protein